MLYLGLIVLIVICYLNVSATVQLLRADIYEPFQLKAQIAIIWLIPVLGTLFVMHFLAGSGMTRIPRDSASSSVTELILGGAWLLSPKTFYSDAGDGGGSSESFDGGDGGGGDGAE